MPRSKAGLLFLLTLACAAPPRVTTIIIVRHAERASQAQDSPLSEAGVVRANELARVLASSDVAAIYVTPFVRTQQTAAPLARADRLQPVIVQTGKDYPHALTADVLSNHAGQTVVVVSHADTIPSVLRELGVQQPPQIASSEYDDLFVCTVTGTNPAHLLTLRYGAAQR